MYRQALLDPTAGERARRLHERPELTPPITDPTDPRYGRPRRDPRVPHRARRGSTAARAYREAPPAARD
jgi:hypothetical protein